MIWKTILVAFFAGGVLAEDSLPKEVLKQTCTEDIYKGSLTAYGECVKDLGDMSKTETGETIPDNAVEEYYYKRMCKNKAETEQVKTCLHALASGMSPCLEYNIDFLNNATDQIFDFFCFNNGEKIGLLFAENGRCLQQANIQACGGGLSDINKKFGVDVKKLTLDEQCAKFDRLSTCIMNALENCSTPTLRNTAESLLRDIKDSSACKNK